MTAGVALGIAMGMAALVWSITRGAVVGVSPDSIVYLDAARHLQAGDGVTFASNLPGPGPDAGRVPLTHYPPGYPALLALVMAIAGVTAEVAARLCGIAFAFLNVLVVAAIARRAAPPALALLIAASFAIGIPLQLHVMAWSEPPFLFFTNGALLALAAWAQDRARRRWLVAAAVCGALAFLMRYTGIVLVGVAALFIVASAPATERRRILRDALVVAAAMTAPVAWWILRSATSSEGTANRRLALHLIDGTRVTQGLETVARFLSPLPRLNEWEHVAWGLAWLALGAWCIRASWRRGGWRAVQVDERALPITFVAAYVAFLVVSISLLDYATPMDSRILAPVIVPLWWTALLLVGWLARERWRWRTAAAWGLLLGIPSGAMVRGTELLSGDARLQYTSAEYRSSAIWGCLGALATPQGIVSNKPELVYYRLGVQAVEVPSRRSPYTNAPNPTWAADSARVNLLLRGGAALALFPPERDYHESFAELRRRLSLERIFADSVGEVWRARAAAMPTCTP